MRQTFGDFRERDDNTEFLAINFSPSSIPLRHRWRNNGLSADFLGDYWANFFPTEDESSMNRQAEIKDAVTYIANELLENAMKFNYEPSQCTISIALYLYENELRFYVSNGIDPSTVESFQRFIQELLTEDTDELYMRQLEQSAEDDSEGSHLGFLTMINDYHASLAWKFESVDPDEQIVVLTSMVQLTV